MENPEVLWAQSRERLFLTIRIVDLKEQNIEILENCLKFNGKNETNEFNLNLKLYKTIRPNDSSWSVKANRVEFSLRKDGNFFWSKLLEEKYNNLRIDWSRWQDEDDSDDEVNQNRREMLDNFGEFTKTLPSELMDKDFSELFNEDLNEEITDDEIFELKDYGEEYDASPSSEDGFVDNIDVRNVDPEMMSKMEEGLITRRDRESLSSPEDSLSGDDNNNEDNINSGDNINNEDNINSEEGLEEFIPDKEIQVKEDGPLLEEEFKIV